MEALTGKRKVEDAGGESGEGLPDKEEMEMMRQTKVGKEGTG